ncbi:MAG: hypothetical protein ISS20_19930 [Acidovorax sp.]|nr:hypothetical protein [Acidovorax sp.]
MICFVRISFCLLISCITGCTVIPTGAANSACELLNTASQEADLAPAWYLRAGEVLEACGQDRAKVDAAARACYAEVRNGYRDSKECEAMP